MTNTGKVLIIGLLVIDLGVGGYLLVPKDDERAPAATGAVVSETDDLQPRLDLPASAARSASGSVLAETPSAGADNKPALAASVPFVSMAPPAAVPRAPALPAVPAVPSVTAPPPLVAAAPRSTHSAPRAADKPSARSRAQDTASARRDARAKPKTAQLAGQGHERKQDDSHRRESTQQAKSSAKSKSVSTAMTARLVKESAKPDPSLPLPPSGAHSSNPVAAAMTDQLVRESSRVSAPPSTNSQYGKH